MNDFEIITKLGEGAYSVVYKVKRIVDNQIYALKKVKLLNLSEKEKLNALNEVRILASVKSNFVISYKEAFFDEKDSTLGIVMEYADKGDLYQRIVEHKKAAMFLEESDIWRIFIQLVKGLKALHDLKILHRDLKSANVFIFNDGSAKLGDLNVSKVARRGLGYTQTGTPYYASPEVWKDQPYDNKSDIWSLGCVLYEMITLRPPFRAENMEGLYNKVIKGQYNKIPERFSPDLVAVVKMLLIVNADSRPSCDKILKNPIIQKRIEYFKSFSNEDLGEDQALLQTIRIPKNLLFLSDRLPAPNYEKMEHKNYNSFTNHTKDKPKNGEIAINAKLVKKNTIETKITEEKSKKGTSDTNEKDMNKKSTLQNLNSSEIQKVESKPKNSKHRANSLEIPNRVKEKIPKPRLMILNELKRNQSNDMKNKYNNIIEKYAELPQLNSLSHKKIELSKDNSKPLKVNNYNGGNNINHLYKIYAPYLQNGQSVKMRRILNHERKKSVNSGNISIAYLNNLEKYYENYNLYKKKIFNKGYDQDNSLIINLNNKSVSGPEVKQLPKILQRKMKGN